MIFISKRTFDTALNIYSSKISAVRMTSITEEEYLLFNWRHRVPLIYQAKKKDFIYNV